MRSKRRGSDRQGRFGKRSPLVWIIPSLLFVILIIYIIYAMTRPEVQAPTTDLAAVETQAQTQAAATTMDASATEEVLPTDNPIATVLSSFSTQWDAALDIMKAQETTKDLSYAFSVMDISKADIFRDVSALETDNGSGQIVERENSPGTYDITTTTANGDALTGRVNTITNSLYYIIKTAQDKTARFVEIVPNGGECYVQLFNSSGPYKGVLLYDIGSDGSIRAAFMSEERFAEVGGISTIYGEPPSSWETFSANATPYFSALRSETQTVDSNIGADSSSVDTGIASATATSEASTESVESGASIAPVQSRAPQPQATEEPQTTEEPPPDDLPEE